MKKKHFIPEPTVDEFLPYCRSGIIFSAPMVMALLAGRKTVTRRIDRRWLRYERGELLYVREGFTVLGTSKRGKSLCLYGADRFQEWRDGQMPNPDKSLGRRYPSIHMPRSFSRAVLKLTNKPRLERVQDITEIDARAEGVAKGERCDAQCREPFRHGFIDIWHKLHTKPGERWQDNPEIVRLQFMRVA